jgi:hypothetical protein
MNKQNQLPANYCEMIRLNIPLYRAFVEARNYLGTPKVETIRKAIAKTDTRTTLPEGWEWR